MKTPTILLLSALLSLCAADNQTLLVTQGDSTVSVNDTSISDEPPQLPPGFYAPESLARIGVQIYVVDSNETVADLCADLSDFVTSILTCEADAPVSLDQANATDDTYVVEQTDLDTIRATDAWAKGYLGSSAVRICVVDSGAPLDHPDFGANLWTNAAEADGRPGVDDDNNGVVDDIHGASFLNGNASGNVQDQNSHG